MVEDSVYSDLFTISENGEAGFFHTATAINETGIHQEVDAAGFGNVEGYRMDYITGAITAGEDTALMLLNLDRFASLGGGVNMLECLSTTGAADAECIHVGVGLDVIHQTSGTLGNMSNATTTDSGTETNRRAAFIDTGTDVTIFPANSDNVLIGDTARFGEISFVLDTEASGAGIKPTFEYSSGVDGSGDTTWATFNAIDGTNGMRDSGEITIPVEDIGSAWVVGSNVEFQIRITRTQGGLGTVPIENIVQIAAVTDFRWNLDGLIQIDKILASSTANNFAGLGVATNTPGTLFSVHGAANFGTGTSTIYSGLTLPTVTATSGLITLGTLTVNSESFSDLTGTGLVNTLGVLTVDDLENLAGTLDVGSGGTGATSLTDGGVLLGSGTAAITPMSVLSDGSIIVGDGAADPVALAAFTNSTGDLRHEAGGLEFDASAVTTGDLIHGSSAGTMALLTVNASSTILTVLASGLIDYVSDLQIDSLRISQLTASAIVLTDGQKELVSGTAGRSLTLSGTAIDADSELFTYSISASLHATTSNAAISTTSKFFVHIEVPVASTITGFTCNASPTLLGTSTVAAVLSTDGITLGTELLYSTGVECGTEFRSSTSTFGGTALAAGDVIYFYVVDGSPVGSPATILYPSFTVTKDD